MIDGLKLTLTGDELQRLLAERVARRICSHPEIIEITNPYARPAKTDGPD